MIRNLATVCVAVLAVLAVLVAPSVTLAQGVIEIRAHATVEPGEPVRLGRIAVLSGTAQALADAKIADGPGKLSIDEIRAALDRDREIAWDDVILRGRACEIRAAGASPPTPSTVEPGLEFTPANALVGDGTIRGLIAATLARELSVDPHDLRCGFDPADRDRLARSVGHDGSSVEVRSLASGDSRPVLVNVFTPDGAIDSATTRVRVEVRREAATASRDVPRGRVITREDVAIGARWTPPGAVPASPSEVIGSTVQQRLSAGELIEASDLARPYVVKKGEIVRATCVRGGFAVETNARAMGQARDGEEFSLQSLDRKQTFRARASGPGRAVVINSEPSDAGSSDKE